MDLVKKLQIKAGAKLRLINLPKHIHEELTRSGEVKPARAGSPCDGAIVFCDGPSHVEEFVNEGLAQMPYNGLLWFAYRKGAAAKEQGLSRDQGWEHLRDAGWDTVRSVAFDEEWSGLRFRPKDLVSRKK